MALEALAGVGDEAQQWEEDRAVAYHIRRRLTVGEQGVVGAVEDLRGTPEGWARFARVKVWLPPVVQRMAVEELG